MGLDVSTLSVKVESSGVSELTTGLNNLYSAAEKAEARTATLTSKIESLLDKQVKTATDAAQKQVDIDSKQWTSMTREFERFQSARRQGLDMLSKEYARTQSEAISMNNALDKITQDRLAAEESALAKEYDNYQKARKQSADLLAKQYAEAQAEAIKMNNALDKISASRIASEQAALAKELDNFERAKKQAADLLAKQYANAQAEAIKMNALYDKQAAARIAAEEKVVKELKRVSDQEVAIAEAKQARLNKLNDNFAAKSLESQYTTLQRAVGYGATGRDITERFGSDVALKATTEGLAEYKKKLDAATQSHHELSLASGGTIRELIVLANELQRGDTSRMTSSMMVLANRTGAAQMVIQGLVSTIGGPLLVASGAAVGALAFIAVEMLKGVTAADQFNRSMLLVGNYSGSTRANIEALAESIQTPLTGGFSAAKDMATAFAASGHFTGETLKLVTQTALRFAELSGQSSEKVIQHFENMKGSAVEWATKMDQTYHFLNAASLEHIMQLEKEGKHTEAMTEVLKLFRDGLDTSKDHVNLFSAAIRGIGLAYNDLKEKIMGWAVGPTIEKQAEQATAKVKELTDKMMVMGRLDPARDGVVRQLKVAMAEEMRLTKQAADEQVSAAKAAHEKEIDAEGVAAAERMKVLKRSIRTRAEIRQEEHEQIRRDAERENASALQHGQQLLYTEQQIQDLIAKADEKYKDRKIPGNDNRKQILLNDLENIKAVFEQEKVAYEENVRAITDQEKRKEISIYQAYDLRKQQRQVELAAENKYYEDASNKLANYNNKTLREEAETQKQLDKLFNDHQKRLQLLNNVDLDDKRHVHDEELKALNDQINGVDKLGKKELDTLNQTLEAQKKHNAEIGKTKEQIEAVLAAREVEKTKELEAQADAIQMLLDKSVLIQNEIIGIQEAGVVQAQVDGDARKIYEAQLAELRKLIAARKELTATYADGKILQAQADAVKKASDAWKVLDKKIETDLANAIVDGGGQGLKKLIKDMEVAFAKLVLQPIISPIASGVASIVNPGAAQAGSSSLGFLNTLSNAASIYKSGGLSGIYNSALGYFGIGTGSMGALGATGATTAGLGTASGMSLVGTGSGIGLTAGGLGSAEGMSLVGSGASTGLTLGSGAVGGATNSAGAISGAAGGAGGGGAGAATVGGWIMAGMMLDNALYNKGFKPNWSSIDNPIGKIISAPDFGINSSLKAIGVGDKLASILSGSSISQYLFGRSEPKITNSGIEGTVTSSAFKDSRNFADITEEGGLFAGNDNYSKYSALDKGIQSALSNAFASSYKGFNELGKVIGAGSDIIKDFTYNFKVSLNGLNDADAQKKVASALAGTSDAMASAFVDKFRSSLQVATVKSVSSDVWFGDMLTQIVDKKTEMHTVAQQGAKSNIDPYIDDVIRIFDSFKTSLNGVKDSEGKLALFTASLFNLGENFVQMKGYVSEFGEALDFKKLESAATGVETVLDTFDRLDKIFTVTNTVAIMLGQNAVQAFGAVGLASTDARQRLIDLAGGIDTLTKNADYYAQNFLTPAEQMAPVMAVVGNTLLSVNAAGVKTKDQFKALVSSLDLSSEVGQKEYVTLMKLAPAFVQITDYMDKLRAATIAAAKAQGDYLLTQADNALNTLKKSVEAQKTALQAAHDTQVKAIQDKADLDKKAQSEILSAAQASNSALKSVFDSLTSAITATQVQSTALDAQRRQDAIKLLTGAVGSTNTGGDVSKVAGLTDALQVVAKPSEVLYETFQDYARDQSVANNAIVSLQSNAKFQLSAAQLTIDAINATITAIDSTSASQIAALDAANAAEQARLDSIVTNAQAQLDALRGIDDSVKSVAAALQAFNGAIGNAKANPVASATGAITAAYQNSLGRAPEAAGLQFWQDQVASGQSVGSVVNAIQNSNEAKVQELYSSVLGRTGETAGVQYWTNLLNNGMSVDEAKADFLNSAEYKSLHPSFAVGTNMVPHDMLANIHAGERIVPAADNAEIMARLKNPQSNGESAEERKQLLEAINKLTQYVMTGDVANVQQTKELVKIYRKWDGEGLPATRSV